MHTDANKARSGLTPEDRKENALRPCACLGYERDKLAMYLLKRGMHGLAEAQLRRAVWLNPFEPAFKVHLAWCLYEKGRLEEARDWAVQALAQKDDPRAREVLRLVAQKTEVTEEFQGQGETP